MAAVHTSLVKRRHAYTSANIPWAMDMAAEGVSPDSAKDDRRLFRYLSGGGMRAFGRTSRHELLIRRQTRFLWLVGVLTALWLVFSFV